MLRITQFILALGWRVTARRKWWLSNTGAILTKDIGLHSIGSIRFGSMRKRIVFDERNRMHILSKYYVATSAIWAFEHFQLAHMRVSNRFLLSPTEIESIFRSYWGCKLNTVPFCVKRMAGIHTSLITALTFQSFNVPKFLLQFTSEIENAFRSKWRCKKTTNILR